MMPSADIHRRLFCFKEETVRIKVSAAVMSGDLYFEGLHSVGGGWAKPGDVRKWFDGHKKKAPWVCPVCQESVGAEGERVAVWVDLADSNCFEVVHRHHPDQV